MENLEVDMSLALQLQAQFEEELRVSLLKQEAEQRSQVLLLSQDSPGPTKKNKLNRHGEIDEPPQEKLSVSLIDPTWELIDPNPNIHSLFLTFDNQFFWGRLAGIEVKWSPRMTLCAGVCCYEGRGGLCSVRLSLPLLKLRPRKDLIETLLHEMIHAYLFVTANNRDRDGHGPEFHKHMYRLNGVAGTKISVYHTFHDEVDVYRQHIWQCNGPCRQRKPYFGLVKRAMNRVPGPRDPWWPQHQQSCGGTYSKIQEPEGYGDKKKKKNDTSLDKKSTASGGDIRKFFGGFQGEGKSLMSVPGPSATRNEGNPRLKGGISPPLKENIPGYNKSKVGHKGSLKKSIPSAGNPSSLNKTSTTNVVHGLGSTATGTVKQVNVKNATRSKVHGFSGSSPAKKKPRLGSGSDGTGGAKQSGSSSSGSGLAVKSGGGSKTVTVKEKVPSKTQTETSSENAITSAPAFHGQGFSLGRGPGSGPGSGVSRLLSRPSLSSSASSGQRNTSDNRVSLKSPLANRNGSKGNGALPEKTVKSSTGDSDQKDNVKCPVCSKDISQTLINEHLNQCIGEFDDDDDWDTSCAVQRTSSKERSKEADTISVSSDDSGDFFPTGKTVPTASSSSGLPKEIPRTEETYSCPVCNDRFSQSNMNEHLDTHF